jgi:predicted protein tyrosine phosphatase
MTAPRPVSKPLPSTSVHVCPLAAIHDIVTEAGASHLMTVINAHTPVDTPPLIAPGRHLKILINDISVPQEGLVHPKPEHIDEILRFARDWDHAGPLVVHCWAGISRSTAAAFISLCALNEDGLEHEIARSIREASSTATPNRLMVKIADDTLGRNGRMVDAIRAIGDGKPAIAGTPFSIPSRFRR